LKSFVKKVGERIDNLGAEMVGCTTAGEISRRGATNKCASLILIESDEIDFTVGSSEEVYEDPEESARKALEEIKDKRSDTVRADKFLMVLSAAGRPKNKPTEFGVLKGITKNLEEDIPIVGGSAGDELKAKRTYQFHNRNISTNAVVLVEVSSDLPFEIGLGHGMDKKIASGVVNEAEKEDLLINKIKGQKAADFYAKSIGAEVSDISDIEVNKMIKPFVKAYRYIKLRYNNESLLKINKLFDYSVNNPLATNLSKDDVRIISPLDITEDKSIHSGSEVNEAEVINVVEGDKEEIVLAGKRIFESVKQENEPLFGIVADSVIRNHIFTRNELEKEIGEMRQSLSAPVIGFYGYGQIGPVGSSYSTFNNQSIAGFVIYRNEF